MQGEKEVTDWTHTLRMLHDTCTARNVELDISESKKIVQAVLEKLASGTTVESYQQCMTGLRDISKTKPGGQEIIQSPRGGMDGEV